MHRLRREVRLATTWARPQRNAFYDEEVGALAKAAGHVFQLNLAAAAMRATMSRIGKNEFTKYERKT